jgi:hypothetical protein
MLYRFGLHSGSGAFLGDRGLAVPEPHRMADITKDARLCEF